jgi:hypothetical protein
LNNHGTYLDYWWSSLLYVSYTIELLEFVGIILSLRRFNSWSWDMMTKTNKHSTNIIKIIKITIKVESDDKVEPYDETESLVLWRLGDKLFSLIF